MVNNSNYINTLNYQLLLQTNEHINRPRHMALEILALAWDMHIIYGGIIPVKRIPTLLLLIMDHQWQYRYKQPREITAQIYDDQCNKNVGEKQSGQSRNIGTIEHKKQNEDKRISNMEGKGKR